jgi:hypothetical protein
VTLDTDEEARAAEYRAQQIRRADYQAQLWNSLAGSQAARDALYAAWQPLIDYLAERDMEVDSEAEIDPIGISDTVNVGRTTE